ncbi:sirohydrochlorin cobaltochelatase [Clostridia bacterium]|nr:sirohydrochlorin cobaltochelatase [Clostridia bacterium]
MTGVLILAHGSREAQTIETMEKIERMVKDGLPDVKIRSAYLQFNDINLEAGLNALIADGVTDIRVVPYFLFSGVHIREDIPAEIDEFLKGHPGITVKMGGAMEADPRLADILKDKILGML